MDLVCYGEHSACEADKTSNPIRSITDEIREAVDFNQRLCDRRQLNDSSIRSQAVIDHMLDGLAVVSSEGHIEFFNKAAERMFNYRADEVIGQSVFNLLTCRFTGEHDCNLQNCLVSKAHAAAELGWEVTGLRKDRSSFPLELVVSKIELGTKWVSSVLLRDISKRKAIEEELRDMSKRLRQLAAHQESVRENERTRIARELHDELGGLLTAARFDVNRLSRWSCIPADSVDKLRESLDAAIGSTRSIIADLRPPVIDHLGLWGAVEWYADELANRRGLRCQVVIEPELQDLHPAHDVSIALFRIVQEALSNVVKHAQAHSIMVCLRRLSVSQIEVKIIDDGNGVCSEDLAKPGHWGILGMRERVHSHGGELTLKSELGRGTTLHATLRIG